MTGSVLVVTGASRGIGAATAELAAARGWRVAACGRDGAALAEVVARCPGSVAFVADLRDDAQVVRLFAEVDARLGPPAGLVANAGVVDVVARVDEMTAERVQQMFAANVFSVFSCVREAVLRMSTRHGGAGGSIVTVSSGAATGGGPGQYVDYAASKGAVDTLTRGLALEVAAEGIRVNGVRPGVTDTGIHATGGQPDKARLAGASIPLGRAGRPDEVAAAVLYLLEDATFTTGAMLDVTGGR